MQLYDQKSQESITSLKNELIKTVNDNNSREEELLSDVGQLTKELTELNIQKDSFKDKSSSQQEYISTSNKENLAQKALAKKESDDLRKEIQVFRLF